MPVIDVRKDPEALTLTITARFDAPPERVWPIWQDPRVLERWWGPPGYPATFVGFDLAPGGTATYYMTGPDGGRYHGWWRVVAVDPPRGLEFTDGFGEDPARPDPLPVTTTRVTLAADGEAATRMTIEGRFPSTEAMEKLLAMGMDEGMSQALGQVDGLLAAGVG